MLVVIANDLPDAVRGRLKLWFVEPQRNVFVSGIKDNVADKVIEHVLKECPPSSGVMIFKRCREAPGYRIYGRGTPKKRLTSITGLQLVVEKETAMEEKVEKKIDKWG